MNSGRWPLVLVSLIIVVSGAAAGLWLSGASDVSSSVNAGNEKPAWVAERSSAVSLPPDRSAASFPTPEVGASAARDGRSAASPGGLTTAIPAERVSATPATVTSHFEPEASYKRSSIAGSAPVRQATTSSSPAPSLFPPNAGAVVLTAPGSVPTEPAPVSVDSTAPGNSVVQEGQRVAVQAVETTPEGDSSLVVDTQPVASPSPVRRSASGFTYEEDLFRARWGWAAYDASLKAAKDAAAAAAQ